jgi:lipopolysaccharide export system protein LptC
MRRLFYRIAFLLALFSLVPLIVFLARRESPPEKLSVKVRQKQTVENFSLKSTGKSPVWTLNSPLAVFKDKERIELEKPSLTLYLSPPVEITASKALFDREKRELYLHQVHLVSEEVDAYSPSGVYFLNKALFKTDSGCKIISGASRTSGKVCTLYLKSRKFVVEGSVKTTISEVEK